MDLLIMGGVAALGLWSRKCKESFDDSSPLGPPRAFATPRFREDAFPQAFEQPSMYESALANDEMRADAMSARATPAHDPPRAPTANVVKGNVKFGPDDKSKPFFKSAAAQHHSEDLSTRRIDMFTGNDSLAMGWDLKRSSGDKAPGPMFKPQPNRKFPGFERNLDRVPVSSIQNNHLPFEQERVGPGVNVGPDVQATGGFHPTFRVMPNLTNTYRTAQLPGRVIPGKAPVDLGSVAPLQGVGNNKPNHTLEPNPRGMEPAAASVHAPRMRPNVGAIYKSTQRDTTNDLPGHAVSVHKARTTRPDASKSAYTRERKDPEPSSHSHINPAAGVNAHVPGAYKNVSGEILKTTDRETSAGDLAFGAFQKQGGGGVYSQASSMSRPHTSREAYPVSGISGIGQHLRASGTGEGPRASSYQVPGTNRGSNDFVSGVNLGPATSVIKAPSNPEKPEARPTNRATSEYTGNPQRQMSGHAPLAKMQMRPPLNVYGYTTGPQNNGGMRALEALDSSRVPRPEDTLNKPVLTQTLDVYAPLPNAIGNPYNNIAETTSTAIAKETADPRSSDLDLARRQLFGNDLATSILKP